jgi:ABC-2 type transport system permease protein
MVSLTIQRELAHRVNLFFQATLALTQVAAGLAALSVIYTRVNTLAGWTAPQAIILLGIYEIVSGLLQAFIEPNLAFFSNKIYGGELDDLLLQPVPSLFIASFSTCQPWALAEVGLGMLIVGLSASHLGIIPTPGNIGAALLLLLAGVVIMWASRVLLASLAFWAQGLELSVLYSGWWQLGRYPITIYPGPIRWMLTYIVPVGFIATFPAFALCHPFDPLLLAGGAAAALGAMVAVRLVWHAALRKYSSATS